jgi:hypothetical protein
MELQYIEAMEKHGLELSDLPEDAQIGIEQINGVLKAIKMLEKKGTQIPEKTVKKVKAMDKWVYYEILDLVHETDQNEEEIPYTEEDITQDIDNEINTDDGDDNKEIEVSEGDSFLGKKIESELQIIYDSGKTIIAFDDLKNLSRTSYNVIFDGYSDSQENGIITSKFSLLETDQYVFELKKTN